MMPSAASSRSIRRPWACLDGGRAAHDAARTVAGRAEGPPHAARLAGQDPACPAHVAGNNHRLADLAIASGCRDGRRGTPGSPPCDARKRSAAGRRSRALPSWRYCGPRRRPGSSASLPTCGRRTGECLAGLPHQELPVRPGVIGRAPHRAEIVLALGAFNQGAGQLPVGQLDAVLRRHLAQGRPARRRTPGSPARGNRNGSSRRRGPFRVPSSARRPRRPPHRPPGPPENGCPSRACRTDRRRAPSPDG